LVDPTGHRECGANDNCSDFVFVENIRLPDEVPMLSQLANEIGPDTSCGPTALTMVLQYLLGVEEVDPATVITNATTSFDEIGEPLYTPYYPPYTSPEHLTELANFYSSEGINVTSGNFGPNDNQKNAQNFLRDELRQGHPVIVDVTVDNEELNVDAAHFVVITGIDEDNTVHFIDPYTSGTGVSRKRESWTDFWNGWQNNSDRSIGGQGYYLSVWQQ